MLFLSIGLEVFSTQMMKLSDGFSRLMPSAAFAIGMAGCFFAFSKTLTMLPLGVSYAIWAGLGTALTAILSVVLWKETLDFQTGAGILFIIVGVVLLNLRQ